jgi:2-dehydropantoate 2-reductase
MRWKYSKLLANLGNAEQALFGTAPPVPWHGRAREEALECYRAAGIAFADDAEVAERTAAASALAAVNGRSHAGGSSWQSLVRGSGSIETDYLNGEIVLLGRLHGVATPVNQVLAETAGRMARDREAAGSADPAAFARAVEQLAG